MIEKKDPDRKIVEDGFSDDDPIIELTDEILIEPEEDRKPASPKTDDVIPSKTDKDPALGDDEGIIVFENNAKSSMLDDFFTDMDGDSPAIIEGDTTDMTGDDTRYNFDDEIELEYDGDEDEIDFFTDDEDLDADNDVIAMPSEASPTFGKDVNGIDMLADIEFEREEGDGIISLAELDSDDVETDDDIIEITEFDQHFSDDDDDETLALAGLLDASDLKDEDFLELFDIEEEGPMDDEEMRELSESEEKAVEAELSRFFDDAQENETGIEGKAPSPVEKLSEPDIDLDLAMTAATLSAGTGKFNRPKTPFPPDPADAKEELNQKDSPESNATDLTAVSPEAIDRAIERIINEKLAGRIEHIIYEIIEKSVKREIDRLKESLLEDSPPKDNL
jgi:hypothetical protein